MAKKILFKAGREHVQHLLDKPNPSSSHVPDWYKQQKLFSNGENDFVKANIKSYSEQTYKFCVPLVDTLTSGYMFVTSADIYVKNSGILDNYDPVIEWATTWNVLDTTTTESLGNYPVPYGHSNTVFRWDAEWKIITPKGYSMWITHPSHRYDLPFITINGFVDTDRHPNRLKFPFFVREGFEGLISKGTPIAQAIPVKRENWESLKLDYDLNEKYNENYDSINMNFVRAYKRNFWSKKNYK